MCVWEGAAHRAALALAHVRGARPRPGSLPTLPSSQAPPVQPAAAAAADREGDSPELHAAKRELLFSIVILVAIALVLHFRLGWIVAEGLPAPTKKAWRDVVVANLAGPLQRLFAAWRVGPQEAAAAEVFAAAVAKGLAADWPRKTVFAFLATTGSAAALLGLKAYNTCLTEMYRAGKRRSWLEAAAAFLWKAAAFLWESAGTFFWEVLARRRGAGADGGGTGAASSGEGGATAASGNGRGEV